MGFGQRRVLDEKRSCLIDWTPYIRHQWRVECLHTNYVINFTTYFRSQLTRHRTLSTFWNKILKHTLASFGKKKTMKIKRNILESCLSKWSNVPNELVLELDEKKCVCHRVFCVLLLSLLQWNIIKGGEKHFGTERRKLIIFLKDTTEIQHLFRWYQAS